MDSPLPHKRQVVGVPLPLTLPAIYMPADIPAEVPIPPPQQSTGVDTAPLEDEPTIDLFNHYYTLESNPDKAPDPLKRRSKMKKAQGGPSDCPEARSAETQDVDMSPVMGRAPTLALLRNRAPPLALLRNRAPPLVLLRSRA